MQNICANFSAEWYRTEKVPPANLLQGVSDATFKRLKAAESRELLEAFLAHQDSFPLPYTEVPKLKADQVALLAAVRDSYTAPPGATTQRNIPAKKYSEKSAAANSVPVPAYPCTLAGTWNLDVPYAQDNWSAEDCSMRLIEGPTHSIIMGEFDIGLLEGVLKCRLPHTAPSQRLALDWRGRETGENEIVLNNNFGHLTLTSQSTIKGILKSTYGDFEFTGKRAPETPTDRAIPSRMQALFGSSGCAQPLSEKSLRNRWRKLGHRNHGRQGSTRWGRWCEEVSDSDDFGLDDSSESDPEDSLSSRDSDNRDAGGADLGKRKTTAGRAPRKALATKAARKAAPARGCILGTGEDDEAGGSVCFEASEGRGRGEAPRKVLATKAARKAAPARNLIVSAVDDAADDDEKEDLLRQVQHNQDEGQGATGYGFLCDNCSIETIVGPRWKCKEVRVAA
jgi:hypothetical protein